MTNLEFLMGEGYRVSISEMVTPGEVFLMDDLLVVHPLDYSYLAYDDVWRAHAENMTYLNKKLEQSYSDALERLDRMVDDYNRRNEPQLVLFLPNVEAIENEDGSYTFSAQPIGRSWEERQKLRAEYEGEN